MPAIAKIRFTNIIYENGAKRINDDIFEFDGENGVILLENGGGKTVLVQTALQAVLPHADLGERKIRDTLSLEGGAAHIAIEWILNNKPRRYAITAVSLFLTPNGLNSLRYVFDYSEDNKHKIEHLPFVKTNQAGDSRPISRQEIQAYYQYMQDNNLNAHTFNKIKDFHQYIEENFHIIPSEWKSIAYINGTEGGVEKFFENCKTTSQLVDQLLIPIVEETLVGNGTDDFVQIYEMQREHFVKHRELRSRIEESKNIEQKILHYVNVYTKLHEIEERVLTKKKEAKSIYNFLKDELRIAQDEKKHLEGLGEKCQKEKHEISRKESSYELAVLTKELEEAQTSYDTIKAKYVDMEQKRKTAAVQLQNLEIAELKVNINHYENKHNLLLKQLAELDQDQNITDLKTRLETNSKLLKGYFTSEKNKLNTLQKECEDQRGNLEIQSKKNQGLIDGLRLKEQSLMEKRASYRGEIKGIEHRMSNIHKAILASPLNETIAGEFPKWKERTTEIEKLYNINQFHLKELKKANGLLTEEIPMLNVQIQNLIRDTTAKNKDITTINLIHDDLLTIVRNLRLEWYYLDSIYIKQESITQYIGELVASSRGQKEELLKQERLAFRLLDFYGENAYFTAEPLMEEWVTNWKNQFHFLELGPRYIENVAANLGKTLTEIYLEFPFWPLVLITSTGELPKLTDKIINYREKLTFPILILSQEEVVDLLQGGRQIEERYVYPLLWERNVEKRVFKVWKNELKDSSAKVVITRKEKETEEKEWQDLLDSVIEYLDNYPYENYMLLNNELRMLETDLEQNRTILIEKEQRKLSIDQEIQDYQTKLDNLEDEANYLSNKISLALEYFEKEKEKEHLQYKIYQKTEEIEIIQKELDTSKKTKNKNDLKIRDIDAKMVNINLVLQNILNEPVYKEVENYEPIFKDLDKIVLLEERKYMQEALEEKQKGREEINRQIKDVKEHKDTDEELLKRKYKAALYPVDESLQYPYNGKYLIQELVSEVKKSTKELDGISVLLNQEEDNYKRHLYKYENKQADFYKTFREIISFTHALPIIKEQLKQGKSQLADQEKFLALSFKKLEKKFNDIESNIHSLEIKNGKHEFLLHGVEELVLTAEQKQNLPYNRKKIITEIINEMENITGELDNHKIQVEFEKNQFIQFLDSNVRDIRLKGMVVTGIKNKGTLAEVLEWQNRMNQTLNNVIRIYEKNMIEHDKELNQFIQYLYTYLSTLANEIRSIPKNTKVKVDDSWKEIYQIQVPSWDEETAKTEIRKYIDWMTNQLENNEFLDDSGQEDIGKVKKAIKRWLQSKQLLSNILLGKDIKVKCRKVTNDGEVTNIYYSWEHSNQWSGGEKWSKDMALFLGILNYVAEKKQHILPNQKRNRTVIMDNPFGKASSDHVLNPVFFIAEQLGFQFLALTALGEGRFISDYFPVVYSCQLRPSIGGNTTILTKEKSINFAFLKEA